MKIVVLDAFTTTQKELSFDSLRAFGELFVYDYTSRFEVVERICDAEIVLTNKTVLNSEVLALCPLIKYVGVLATGYNVVDIEYCKNHGIVVTNIPTYGTDSVAQLVFAHILEYCHHIGEMDTSVKKGDWCRSRDFSYSLYPLTELAGKTLGIFGFGRIGKRIAEIALAFKMKVIAYSIEGVNFVGVEEVNIDRLFKESDFLSLNAPLNEQTRKIINYSTLAIMKPSCYIINTARGGLIDEDALCFALENGSLSGAGIDVLNTEPPDYNNPLLFTKGVTITPHIAWATREARERLITIAVENVRAFTIGENVNRIC